VFVYRDTTDHPADAPAIMPATGQDDAAYWYDLPVPGARADAPAHVVEEARGPFEPLVSSADPPGTAGRVAESPGAAQLATPDAAYPGQAPDAAGPDDPREEAMHDRARKLEQSKDLYLTAEAIGESNVDKHFDQLLAQQRELISEYFRQPGPASPVGLAGFADEAETDPGDPRDPGPPAPGPAGPSQGAPVTADQPRAW
jgi:hypothetical protein